jgi:hypothetical protein
MPLGDFPTLRRSRSVQRSFAGEAGASRDRRRPLMGLAELVFLAAIGAVALVLIMTW